VLPATVVTIDARSTAFWAIGASSVTVSVGRFFVKMPGFEAASKGIASIFLLIST
jgi:hypothetical protein